MGNELGACSCNDSIKDIVISNDLKIDDVIKSLSLTQTPINEIDEEIRRIVNLDCKKVNFNRIDAFVCRLCTNEVTNEYGVYFKKWIINVIGPNYEFSYLLGLMILPLVSNYQSRAKKANIIAKYIVDYFGKSKNSLYIAIRYIVEINTDHIYKVLKPLLEKGDESIYFEIWNIDRKNRFIQNVLIEFKRIYANVIDQLSKIDDLDKLVCEKSKEKNMSIALERSIFAFFEDNLRYLDGVEIRNNLIRDYYNEKKNSLMST